MKIPINIRAEKTPELLDYVRAEFNKIGSWGGNAGFQDDGTFVEQLEITIETAAGNSILTSWEFHRNQDGSLNPIQVDAPNVPDEKWEEQVRAIVESALAAAINAQKKRFFRRDTFAYMGPNLDGEYWIDRWRLAPAVPDDVDFGTERIVYLDHWVEGVDHAHSISIGMVKAKKVATLLSLFTNIGFYSIPIECRWVYTGTNESKRFQLGYHGTTPYPSSMPKKGQDCPLGQNIVINRRELRSSLQEDHLLHLPRDIRSLFRAFNKLAPIQQTIFFNAAALYWISLVAGRHLPTVQIAYRIAAIDALVEGKEHSQRSFVQLVKKYNPDILDHALEDLYGKVRSAHFHAGEFPLGEYDPLIIGPLSGPEQLERMNLRIGVPRIVQPTLIDWLIDHAQH